MKLLELLEAIELPDLETGDELMVGKFKNRKATIKGFKKDKHNQPVAKTDKGDQQIFKGRVKKLMDEEIEDDDRRTFTCGSCMLMAWALHKHLGWSMVGVGEDFGEDGYPDDIVHVWVEKDGVAIDVMGVNSAPEIRDHWLSRGASDDAAIFEFEPWFMKGFLDDYNWGPDPSERRTVWKRASAIAKHLKGEATDFNEVRGFEHSPEHDDENRKRLKRQMRSPGARKGMKPWIEHGAYTVLSNNPELRPSQPTNILVVDENGNPAGNGTLMKYPKGYVKMNHIWLDTDVRGQGIGQAIYTRILDDGHVMISDTDQSQHARKL